MNRERIGKSPSAPLPKIFPLKAKPGFPICAAQVHNLEELYRLTGTARPGMPHPPFPCLAEEHFSNYEVAEYAEKFRRYYDLGVAPLLDLRGFLEALGYQIFAVSLGKLPDDLKGFFFQDSKLGPIITVNADRAISCRSFTLAHELAHSLYHYDRPPILCRQNDVRLLEQFANRFSSYFLIPDEALHERLRQLRVKTVTRPEDVVHLARYFGVSIGC